MDKNKNCSACNIKLDKDKYQKHRTVCKNCYDRKKRKNSDNTLIQKQQPKINNVNKNNNNRSTFLVGRFFHVKHILCWKFFHEYNLIDIFT